MRGNGGEKYQQSKAGEPATKKELLPLRWLVLFLAPLRSRSISRTVPDVRCKMRNTSSFMGRPGTAANRRRHYTAEPTDSTAINLHTHEPTHIHHLLLLSRALSLHEPAIPNSFYPRIRHTQFFMFVLKGRKLENWCFVHSCEHKRKIFGKFVWKFAESIYLEVFFVCICHFNRNNKVKTCNLWSKRESKCVQKKARPLDTFFTLSL